MNMDLSKLTKKGIYMSCFEDEFVSLDIETTGLSANMNHIIEVAVIKYKNNVIVSKFETLINPETEISKSITRLTGIDNDMVKGCPTIDEIKFDLINFIGDLPIVGHNISFDKNFIQTKYDLIFKNNFIDTLSLSRILYDNLENHKLETIKNYLEISLDSHRACNDCFTSVKILEEFRSNVIGLFNQCEIDFKDCLDAISNMHKSLNIDTNEIKFFPLNSKREIPFRYRNDISLYNLKLVGRLKYISNTANREIISMPEDINNFKSFFKESFDDAKSKYDSLIGYKKSLDYFNEK